MTSPQPSSPNLANLEGKDHQDAPEVAISDGPEVKPADGPEVVEGGPASEFHGRVNHRRARIWYIGAILFLLLAITAVAGGLGSTMARENNNGT